MDTERRGSRKPLDARRRELDVVATTRQFEPHRLPRGLPRDRNDAQETLLAGLAVRKASRNGRVSVDQDYEGTLDLADYGDIARFDFGGDGRIPFHNYNVGRSCPRPNLKPCFGAGRTSRCDRNRFLSRREANDHQQERASPEYDPHNRLPSTSNSLLTRAVRRSYRCPSCEVPFRSCLCSRIYPCPSRCCPFLNRKEYSRASPISGGNVFRIRSMRGGCQ